MKIPFLLSPISLKLNKKHKSHKLYTITNLDFLEKLITSHLRHRIVCQYQIHLQTLKIKPLLKHLKIIKTQKIPTKKNHFYLKNDQYIVEKKASYIKPDCTLLSIQTQILQSPPPTYRYAVDRCVVLVCKKTHPQPCEHAPKVQ
jgi:hypothetical protein